MEASFALQRLGPFHAGQLFVFQPINLVRRESNLVLDRVRLFRRLDVVELRAESSRLLLVPGDLAFQPGPKSLFPAQGVARLRGLFLGRAQRAQCLRNLTRELAQLFAQPYAFQFHALQLYQVFNVCLHPYSKSTAFPV